MVYRQISNDLKEHALRLWNHGWDLEDIGEALGSGVSRSTCYRWRKTFEELGAVDRPPSPLVGHTGTIIRAILGGIEELYLQDSELLMDHICTWFAVEHQIEVTTSAVSRPDRCWTHAKNASDACFGARGGPAGGIQANASNGVPR